MSFAEAILRTDKLPFHARPKARLRNLLADLESRGEESSKECSEKCGGNPFEFAERFIPGVTVSDREMLTLCRSLSELWETEHAPPGEQKVVHCTLGADGVLRERDQ
ncbi:MAG: hypothetical protein KF708_04040 [Pirellulales bacterium]|nr:hypothetical protein [Pirellulales bacterium]